MSKVRDVVARLTGGVENALSSFRIGRSAVGLLAVGVMAMIGVTEAWAYRISTNNATALTVTIRPNADRGVEISSEAAYVNLDLGYVDMNTSTKTVAPATVTIMGNMATTELIMTSTITNASKQTWTFDNVPVSTETDTMAVWALFTDSDTATVPDDDTFRISNATVTTSMVTAGGAGGAAVDVGDTTGRFEVSGGDTFDDMDNMIPQIRRHLWVRMRTPLNTTITADQFVVLDLTVEAAD